MLGSNKITVHLDVTVDDAYGNNKGQLTGLHIVEGSGLLAVLTVNLAMQRWH